MKKVVTLFLALLCGSSFVAAAPVTINNVVICIGFDDTPDMGQMHATIEGMLNTDVNNNLSDYYRAASYGKLNIVSHLVPADGGKLQFYKDPNPRSYYTTWATDAERRSKEMTLLKNAVAWLNTNHPDVFSTLNLDIDADGNCDYITFLLAGEELNTVVPNGTAILWPHHGEAVDGWDITINGKKMYDYNMQFAGSAPNRYFNVGTFAHEGFHMLGAPDLYHPNNALIPLGYYDLMSYSIMAKPQMPTAYTKYKYGKAKYGDPWMNLTDGSTPDTTYMVYPSSANDGFTVNKPALIKIPSSDETGNQWYAIEYRKKEGYDEGLTEEGMLIYRIDNRYEGNVTYNPPRHDEIYLFRAGSTASGNSYTNTGDYGPIINNVPFGKDGRNSFNGGTVTPSTPRAFLNVPADVYEPQYDEQVNILDITYDASGDFYSFYSGDPLKKYIRPAGSGTLTLPGVADMSGTITVQANVKWKVETDAAWLDITSDKVVNTASFVVTANSVNPDNAERTATVTITDIGNQTSATYAVRQLKRASLLNVAASIAASTFTPAFSPDVFDYKLTLPCGINTLKITAAAHDAGGTITYLSSAGASAEPMVLDVSSPQRIPVAIQSETDGGAVYTYNIEVVRPFENTLVRQYWDEMLAVNLNGEYTFTHFQWFKNGVEIPGATTPYLYTRGGLPIGNVGYTVELTTTINDTPIVLPTCPLRPAIMPRTSPVPLKAYPNPASEQVTVENRQWQDTDFVELFDINGRMVRRYRSTGLETTVDLAGCRAGMYILRAGDRTVNVVVK